MKTDRHYRSKQLWFRPICSRSMDFQITYEIDKNNNFFLQIIKIDAFYLKGTRSERDLKLFLIKFHF